MIQISQSYGSCDNLRLSYKFLNYYSKYEVCDYKLFLLIIVSMHNTVEHGERIWT